MNRAAHKSTRVLPHQKFSDVRTQITALGEIMCDEQLLELADHLHEIIRKRRGEPANPPGETKLAREQRSWAS